MSKTVLPFLIVLRLIGDSKVLAHNRASSNLMAYVESIQQKDIEILKSGAFRVFYRL